MADATHMVAILIGSPRQRERWIDLAWGIRRAMLERSVVCTGNLIFVHTGWMKIERRPVLFGRQPPILMPVIWEEKGQDRRFREDVIASCSPKDTRLF
jgi:hypothetical protein